MENAAAIVAADDDDDKVLNKHAPTPKKDIVAESWLVSNGMRYWLWKRIATPEANKSRRALAICIVRCPLVLPSKERRESMSAIARDRRLPSSYVDYVD
ncbi:hypothetical protein T4D_8587 [Trichinella pseudospiralis]|uniref:Uncharacterized protein n=1 Tax=Trichinella pseudospiralis TaxID=6337 RepID=A0A0V1FNE4_TRIPS|nr:hypothetical protein T4D_8587 [Trichinella pseudospiralis]